MTRSRASSLSATLMVPRLMRFLAAPLIDTDVSVPVRLLEIFLVVVDTSN